MQAQADIRESPSVTMKSLLQTLHARLDRQDEQLTAISTKLHYLDSALDGRLARALGSELGPQLSAVEQRLADRLDPANCKGERSPAGCTPTRSSREPLGRGHLPSQSPRAAPRSPDNAPGLGSRGAAPTSAAQARATATSTLKHSFLRRFVHSEEAGRNKEPEHRLKRLRDRLLESVFGICEADPKVGKEGSRAIHPQSHFVTGESESKSTPRRQQAPDHRAGRAGMLSMSCLLLAYSAYAVPMQLSFWDREDPCNPFPTLYIDIFVDTFFMVRPRVCPP
jgi:hypothetical protein